MQATTAVLKELLYFVFIEQFGLYDQRAKTVTEYTAAIQSVSPKVPTTASEGTTAEVEGLQLGERVFIAIPKTPLRLFPTVSIDSVVNELDFGEVVTFHETSGRFSKVSKGDQVGWVFSDTLVLNQHAVKPKLTTDELYSDTHEVTTAIRTTIEDEFHAVATDLPLQDIEYVSYRQLERGVVIPWTAERPRIAGTWQRILKGQPGVHIGVTPKTNAIFEVIAEDGTGEVAYVDAVHPDQSIQLSRVGAREPGIFEQVTLPLTVWRELRPVFISIT